MIVIQMKLLSEVPVLLKRLKVKQYWIISPEQVISELRSVTCHMRSHSVTCHPTRANTPHLNPSQTGRYSI